MKRFGVATALLAAAALPQAFATYGMDVSALVTADQYKCLKGKGIDFSIVRAWRSYGGFDSNARASVSNAWAGGMKNVDVYLFPCTSKSASDQVAGTVSGMKGVKYGQIWIDVETNPSSGCGWGSNLAQNCAYIGQLLDAVKSHGIKPGVYASPYMWGKIAGSSCTIGKNYPLWWADYNNVPGWPPYKAFGGWTKPAIHQFSDAGNACGVRYDKNYY
ncbi:hypothetical protein FNF31_01412 [Cafeteria roenbergensis]|uniref:Lysozyme n=1 Tax=Cafeteria roenbergensis TaxID=33653 RepID=A0A5A8C1J2_CAFRO|nr:hypothetical protein FNF28_07621 [Cafeteria roenbergensis]KAA0166634.1 hypothetical protein FNF31_01412 [Cafeteria roenbergensis]